jgi:hypothetical protein
MISKIVRISGRLSLPVHILGRPYRLCKGVELHQN